LLQENRQLHAELVGLRDRLDASAQDVQRMERERDESMRKLGGEYQSNMEALNGSLEEMRETLRMQEASLSEAIQEKEDASAALEKMRKHFVEFEEDARVAELEEMVASLEERLKAQSDAMPAALEAAKVEALAGSSAASEESSATIARLETRLKANGEEITNLHSVIGQLTADSERAAMNAAESAAARCEIDAMQRRLDEGYLRERGLKEAIEGEVSKRRSAEEEVYREREYGRKSQEDVITLRRALDDSLARLNTLEKDAGKMVDRYEIGRLLVEHRERDEDAGVFEQLASALDLDARQRGVLSARRRMGVLGAVVAAPMAIVQGITADDEEEYVKPVAAPEGVDRPVSLVDAFVNFLNDQISGDDAEHQTTVERAAEDDRRTPAANGTPSAAVFNKADASVAASQRKGSQGEFENIAI